MKKENLKFFVLVLLGAALFGYVFSGIMKYILPCVLPFLIAFTVALAVRRPAERIAEKTHISRRFLRPCIAVFLTALSLGALSFILWRIGDLLWGIFSDIAEEGSLYLMLERITSPEITRLPKGVSDGVSSAVVFLVEKCAELVTRLAVALPEAVVSLLVTFISIVYFSIDIDRITEFLKSLFSDEIRNKISGTGNRILNILGKYVKSYLQIMGITFVIMLAGFMILGVKNALNIALIIAVLDLLPLIGAGAVLLPWSIFAFILGNVALGVGLIILFLVYTVIREAAEPRILGKSLDVHPIVTLISIYTGYALFGFSGLVAFPILSVLFTGLLKKDKSAEVA